MSAHRFETLKIFGLLIVLFFIVLYTLEGRLSEVNSKQPQNENRRRSFVPLMNNFKQVLGVVPNTSNDTPVRRSSRVSLPMLIFSSPHKERTEYPLNNWLVDFVNLLISDPRVSVDILLNSPDQLERLYSLFTKLERIPAGIRILDPWRPHGAIPTIAKRGIPGVQISSVDTFPNLEQVKEMQPRDALERLEFMCAKKNYSAVILRGDEISVLGSQSPVISYRAWIYSNRHVRPGDSHFQALLAVHEKGRIIFENMRDKEIFNRQASTSVPTRYLILPPILIKPKPEEPKKISYPLKRHRICHAGSITSEYKLDEMLDVFVELKKFRLPSAEFLFIETSNFMRNVVYRNLTDSQTQQQAFRTYITHRLRSTPGVHYLYDITFDDLIILLEKECDIAVEWFRLDGSDFEEHGRFSEHKLPQYSRNLSAVTYIERQQVRVALLYFIMSGLPIVLQPLPAFQSLLGLYPYYFDGTHKSLLNLLHHIFEPQVFFGQDSNEKETVRRNFDAQNRRSIHEETTEKFFFTHASKRLLSLQSYFYHDSVFSRHIQPVLRSERNYQQPKKTILFAGPDMRWVHSIVERLTSLTSVEIRIDQWDGPEQQADEKRSLELVEWADVVFVEWCLGNALWYSKSVNSDYQKLIVRFHWLELSKQYIKKVAWNHVDHLVFLSRWVRDVAVPMLPLDPLYTKIHLLPDGVDIHGLSRKKEFGYEKRLGLLGYTPKRKNPLLAIEILAHLHRLDPNGGWSLYLAGGDVNTVSRLVSQNKRGQDEIKYFQHVNETLATLPVAVQRSIQFDSNWVDPTSFFSSVGWILSTSDMEGMHRAVAEGMASGCIPVVRRWDGAAQMFPKALLFSSAEQAAQLILGAVAKGPQYLASFSDQVQKDAQERFDNEKVLDILEQIILSDNN